MHEFLCGDIRIVGRKVRCPGGERYIPGPSYGRNGAWIVKKTNDAEAYTGNPDLPYLGVVSFHAAGAGTTGPESADSLV